MNEIALRLSPTTVRNVIAHLERIVAPELSPDVSTYARGRTRAWLQYEAPLSARQHYRPGLRDTKLWTWLTKIWGQAGYAGAPDVGLALHGPIGIRPHRDASYAHAGALTVNLGPAEWGWHPDRHGQSPAQLEWASLAGGEILRFDCKHLHSSRNLDPRRWAIVLWEAKRPVPTTQPPCDR